MKLKWVKKILLLVIVASVFSISNVKADLPGCKTFYPGEADLTDAYNFDIDKKDGLYYITANPKSDNKDTLEKMKKVYFVVSKIIPNETGKDNSGWIGKSMLPTQTLVMNITGIGPTDAGPGVEVTLTATNLQEVGLCKGYGTVSVAISDFSGETMHEGGTLGSGGEISVQAGKEIACDSASLSKYDPKSFEAKFCEAKLGAATTANQQKEINNLKTYYSGSNAFNEKNDDGTLSITKFDASKMLQFRCDYNWGGTATKENGEEFKVNTIEEALEHINNVEGEEYKADYGYYFKENTAYLYGEGEKTVDLGHYTYHYHNNIPTVGKAITCHVKCEEAVIVQYGPPVAGKAGMCFDYQIKVESRVNCHALGNVPMPKDTYSVCTPHPRCVSKSGKIYNQGGPNEDFKACIDTCDGGKYTDKCTKECYKKVYKKSSKSTKTNLLTPGLRKTATNSGLDNPNTWFNAAKAGNKRSQDPPKHKSYGAYVERGGKIYWYNTITVDSSGKITGGDDGDNKGRWYYYHDWGFDHPYPRVENGIPRSKYCTDNCYWQHNCEADEYLNWGVAELDYDDNYEKYKQAVESCNAMTKCQETRSTYTIKAEYNQKGGERQKLIFPSNGPTELYTCELKKNDSTLNTSAKNASNVVKRYGGCYAFEGCKYGQNDFPTAGKYYMSEWTFPGSYVNKKTGEISYKPEYASDSNWRTRKRKFCLPRDAEPTNSYWYYWYYSTHTHYHYAQDNCLRPEFKQYLDETVEKEQRYDITKSGANIDWNINGTTKEFGYFSWNIDVSCFYALDDGTDPSTNVPTSDDSSVEINCRNTEYRIRTVSNTELFPSSDNDETSNKREPGFNWTDKAYLPASEVGTSFESKPALIQSYIEGMKNEIYSSDDYVDYQFKLTPQLIASLKDYNSKVESYDTYCGNMVSITNAAGREVFYAYQSNLFRPGITIDTTACPSAGLASTRLTANKLGDIKCNNDAAGGSGCNTDYQVK